MILFIAHPVGAAAAPYAFYWFIPIFIAMMRNRTLWHDALASTFTAHAVGSVIWLYTVPMLQLRGWLLFLWLRVNVCSMHRELLLVMRLFLI